MKSSRLVTTATWVAVAVLLVSVVEPDPSGDSLHIGSYNIKAFGKTKMANPDVAQLIKKIVDRYDIVLIQEVRDKTEESVYQLVDLLNTNRTQGRFSAIISEPIGRSTYKEQYVYLYRADRVVVHASYKYNDSRDVFEREPYVAVISPAANATDKFALVGLHAIPSDAVAEIGYLKEVIQDVKSRFGANLEFVVLGDLNADCSYATYDKRVAAGDYLTTNTSYRWLIGEDADTTVRASTDCAYDRFVVPSSLASRVVSGSAVPFDFGAWLGIIETQSLDVSDHYPVEMKLRL